MQNMNIDKPWIDYIAKRTFGMELEFANSAIVSTKGTVITVTDVNNKNFSLDVPGNTVGTIFDDSNNNGSSVAGAGTAKTINQEVTDVGTMSIHVGANQDQVIVIDIPAITTYTLGTDNLNVMTHYTASQAIGFPNYRVLPVRKFHNKVCG